MEVMYVCPINNKATGYAGFRSSRIVGSSGSPSLPFALLNQSGARTRSPSDGRVSPGRSSGEETGAGSCCRVVLALPSPYMPVVVGEHGLPCLVSTARDA